jgi:hypothetical protein
VQTFAVELQKSSSAGALKGSWAWVKHGSCHVSKGVGLISDARLGHKQRDTLARVWLTHHHTRPPTAVHGA